MNSHELIEVPAPSSLSGYGDNLENWRHLARTASRGWAAKKHVILVNGRPQLCAWPGQLFHWLRPKRSSPIAKSLLADVSANFDAHVAQEAARIFQLESQPVTNGVLRSLFCWLDMVRATRPIQLSLARFDRMLYQLPEHRQLALSVDHYNLLYGHLVACQTKTPDRFTQVVAESELAEALAQIQAAAQRLLDHLAHPDSIGFQRIFTAATIQTRQLKINGLSIAELRNRVASMAHAELATQPLVTRHQIVATVAKFLLQLAEEEGSIPIKSTGHRRRPLTKLIKLTQLSPDQLPD